MPRPSPGWRKRWRTSPANERSIEPGAGGKRRWCGPVSGGGARPGAIYGETDDFSYNITKDPVHIRDFHATVLQLLGFDHERFTYRYLGLDQKLTGVEPAKVIRELIA